MAKKPKSHIFSAKTRARHRKMQSPEYFEQHILPKIMDKMSISDLSNPEIQSFKSYLKLQRDKIKTSIQDSEMYADLFNMGLKITRGKYGRNGSELMKEYMRQRQFFQEYNTYQQMQNPNTHPDNTYDYSDMKELMKDVDKWRLLRKLEEIDPRLSYDRAWASDTLAEIERYVGMSKMSYEEVEEIMVNSFQKLVEENRKWDSNIHGFYDERGEYTSSFHTSEYSGSFGQWSEDDWVMNNYGKGFHGKDKAYQRYRSAKRKSSIDDYEAGWWDYE